MDNTLLVDHISLVGDKLLYVFDVFNERLFFIELVEKSMPDPSTDYPKCAYERGNAPQQILMDPIFNTIRDMDYHAVEITRSNATISDNIIRNSDQRGIIADSGGPNLKIAGNNLLKKQSYCL